MAGNFKMPSKKTSIAVITIIAILIIAAIAGTVVFLKDDGTASATDDGQNSGTVAQVEPTNETTQPENGANENQDSQNGQAQNNNQNEQNAENTQNAGNTQNNGNTANAQNVQNLNNGTVQNGQNQANGQNTQNRNQTNSQNNNGVVSNSTTSTETTTTTSTNANEQTAGQSNGVRTTDNIQETTITRNEQIEIPERKIAESHYVGWTPINVRSDLAYASKINAVPDEIVTTKTGTAEVKQGENVTYVIKVENKTDRKLNQVEVKDALNSDVLDITTVNYLDNSAEATLVGNVLVWNVDIDSKSTVTIKFEITVKTNVADGTKFKNSVITNGKEISNEDQPETEVKKATIDILVEKEWENMTSDAAKAHKIDSIKVTLDGTGQAKILDESNEWKNTFTNLAKYDAEGKEIEYTVTESGVNTEDQKTLTKYYNQEKQKTETGIKFINTFDLNKVDDKIAVTVKKEWE